MYFYELFTEKQGQTYMKSGLDWVLFGDFTLKFGRNWVLFGRNELWQLRVLLHGPGSWSVRAKVYRYRIRLFYIFYIGAFRSDIFIHPMFLDSKYNNRGCAFFYMNCDIASNDILEWIFDCMSIKILKIAHMCITYQIYYLSVHYTVNSI